MLVALDHDCLQLCLAWLESADLAALALVSRFVAQCASVDSLWTRILARELGVSAGCAHFWPPLLPQSARPPRCSHRTLHRLWREAYEDCRPAEIALVRAWWVRMERWLECNAPQILATLRPPPSAPAFAEFRRRAGMELSRYLRLLYSFHDGQQAAHLHGLFGGYQLYDRVENTIFLALQQAADMSAQVASQRALIGRFEHMSLVAGQQSERAPDEGLVVFAFSQTSVKLLLSGAAGAVYTNLDLTKGLVPCVAPAAVRASPCALLAWLEEFLSRLERGVFRYEPVDLTRPSETSARSPHRISTFASTEHVLVSSGVEVMSSPLFIPSAQRNSSSEIFCAYSIRMRVLPERLPYASCQLVRRHWVVREGGRERAIDGEAVVGLYPYFDKSPAALAYPFAYQSCTHIAPGGTMEGCFDFYAGSIAEPTVEFQVAIPRFTMDIPAFIF